MKTITLFLLSIPLLGQSFFSGIDNVASDPSGACSYMAGPTYFGRLQYNINNGKLWGCQSSVWTLISSAGGGGGATIPSTTNIIKGDGAGNGADSGYAAQNASTTLTGFLTSTDWNTFNNKQAALGFTAVPNTRNVNTTSPITGGGDLSADRTIACATCVTSAAALTANLPVFGSGLQAAAVGTRSGNTTEVATVTGALTSGNCLKSDASGNVVDAGTTCGGGGGSGNKITVDVYANRPATCSTGDMFYATDLPAALYTKYLCTATNTWNAFLGNIQVTAPPNASGFTAWNATGTTLTTTENTLIISSTTTANWGGYYLAAPATPYNFTIAVKLSGSGNDFLNGTNSALGQCGMLLHASAGGAETLEVQNQILSSAGFNNMGGSNLTSAGAGSSNIFNSASSLATIPIGPGGVLWLRFRDNGTDKYWQESTDGVNFFTVYSIIRTGGITVADIGLECRAARSTSPLQMTVLHWSTP